eukprot:1939095-Rhodomonas_salina.3
MMRCRDASCSCCPGRARLFIVGVLREEKGLWRFFSRRRQGNAKCAKGKQRVSDSLWIVRHLKLSVGFFFVAGRGSSAYITTWVLRYENCKVGERGTKLAGGGAQIGKAAILGLSKIIVPIQVDPCFGTGSPGTVEPYTPRLE